MSCSWDRASLIQMPLSAGFSQAPCLTSPTCNAPSAAPVKCLTVATTVTLSLAAPTYPLEHFYRQTSTNTHPPTAFPCHCTLATASLCCPTGAYAHITPLPPHQSAFACSPSHKVIASRLGIPETFQHSRCSTFRSQRTKPWAWPQPLKVRAHSLGMLS